MKRTFAYVMVFVFILSSILPLISVQGENNPPNADAGTDKYAGTGDTVFFDGSNSSDPDGDQLTYSWDFDDSDGIQEDATGVLVSTVYYAVGQYRVTLTVDDGNNFTDTDTTDVHIDEDHTNRAPTAVINEPSNFSIHNTTSAITFDGSGSSDPDGDLLTYDWDFGDGEAGSEKITTHQYNSSGVNTVVLTVDDGEFQSQASITLLIEGGIGIPGIPPPPPPPTANRPIANANGPYSYMSWDEVNLDSSGSQGGKGLEYCWDLDRSNGIQTRNCFDDSAIVSDWDNNGQADSASGPFPSVYYTDPGSYNITLIIREGYGEMYTGADRFYFYNYTTAVVTIRPHDTVKVDAGKERTTESGKAVTLSGMVKIEPSYENEAIVKCEWDFENDSIVDYVINYDKSENLKKATCSAVHTYTLNQTTKEDTVFTAILTAYADGDVYIFPTSNMSQEVKTAYNTSGNDSINVTIPAPPNNAPILDCGEPDRKAFVGESVGFTISPVDPDDDPITLYEWDFNNDGIVDYSNAASGDTSYTYTSAGQYQARANVTDKRGAIGYCSVNVSVTANKIPLAVIDAPEGADAGDDVDLDGSESYDPDGPNEIASYNWDFDATDGISVDASGQYATHVYTRGGTYTITLTVKDKHGAEDSETQDITIKQKYDVELALTGKASEEVRSGSSTTFNFKITNTGNGNDCFDLDRSGTRSNWGEIDTNQVCLAADEARSLTLVVKVPSSAKAEDQATIKINAVSQGSSSVSDELRVTVSTMQEYKVSIFMKQMSVTLKQGKSLPVTMEITNLGNGDDSFKLTASGPQKSWVRFKDANLKVDAKGTKATTVTFSVSNNGKTGAHVITLMATSSGDGSVKASVTFTVTVIENGSTAPGFDMMGTIFALGAVVLIGLAMKGRKRK